jgi:hypothetical protein
MNTNPEIDSDLLLQDVPVTASAAAKTVKPLPAIEDDGGAEEMAVAA